MQELHKNGVVAVILTMSLVLLAVPAHAAEPTSDATDGSGTFLGLDRATVTRAALAQSGGRNWFIGVRGGAYLDLDEPFVGAELLLPLSGRLWFNPNFELVFIDPGDRYSINLDVHYDLPTSGNVMFWLGAGLALTRFDPPGPFDADTDPGLNLLAGLGFGGTRRHPLLPSQGGDRRQRDRDRSRRRHPLLT